METLELRVLSLNLCCTFTHYTRHRSYLKILAVNFTVGGTEYRFNRSPLNSRSGVHMFMPVYDIASNMEMLWCPTI